MTLAGWAGRIAEAAGQISYPLYTFQAPLAWLFAAEVVSRLSGNLARLTAWGGFVVGICALSWAAFRYIDQPVRNWIAQLLDARVPSPAIIAP